MLDPQIVPCDLMDSALINNLDIEEDDDEHDNVREDDDENDNVREDDGVLTHISRLIFAPLFFAIYLMDSWVEDRVRKIIRKTAPLRKSRK